MSDLDKLAKAVRAKCLNCLEKPARPIRTTSVIFCSASCATSWALRQAKMTMTWCVRHQDWHDEKALERCDEEAELRKTDPRIPLV